MSKPCHREASKYHLVQRYHLDGWFRTDSSPVRVLPSSHAHYSHVIGAVGLKAGPEQTADSSLGLGVAHGFNHQRGQAWNGHRPFFPASPKLCKAETTDIISALDNPVKDRERKLTGNPKPLFLAQKYVFGMEILTECLSCK